MARHITVGVGDNLLHMLIAYGLVEHRRCKCGREVFDKPGEDEPCPACISDARDLAENATIDLLMEEAS